MRYWRGGVLLLLLAVPCAPPVARAGTSFDEEAARRRGIAVLPEILAFVDAPDPEIRLRARRLARQMILGFLEAEAPAGMRLVPGTIHLAADGARCEGGFYLGVHEVTLGQFRPFAEREQLAAERWQEGDTSLPAGSVSLEEARAFAQAHGARLPTLGELERAAHGGGRLRYPWGERFEPARVNSRESGRGQTEPVGSRSGGISIHGIADLLGNVAEWTETPAGDSGRKYVVAGGSYRSYARAADLSTYRLAPTARLADVGFRLARSLPPIPMHETAGS